MAEWNDYIKDCIVADGKEQWNEFCKIPPASEMQINIIMNAAKTATEVNKSGLYGSYAGLTDEIKKYYDLTQKDFILIDALLKPNDLNNTRNFFVAVKSNFCSNKQLYLKALYAYIELKRCIAIVANNNASNFVFQKLLYGVEKHGLMLLEKFLVSSTEIFRIFSEGRISVKPQDAPLTCQFGEIIFQAISLPDIHRELIDFRNLMVDKKREYAAEKELERQQEVFKDMRHSIKNLVSGIQGPLRLLRDQTNIRSTDQHLKQALQGANLIAETVEAHSSSYRSLDRKWRDDFLFEKQKGATSLEIIFYIALHWAIPRLFYSDFNIYEYISKKYFVDKITQKTAENEWYAAESTDTKNEWIQKYLFDIYIDQNSIASELFVRNQYQTRTHLFILLNEIFMNVLKGIAECPREKRTLKLCSTLDNNKLRIKIINSTSFTHSAGNGIGNEVIQNYMRMFSAIDVKNDFISDRQEFLQEFSIVIHKEAQA